GEHDAGNGRVRKEGSGVRNLARPASDSDCPSSIAAAYRIQPPRLGSAAELRSDALRFRPLRSLYGGRVSTRSAGKPKANHSALTVDFKRTGLGSSAPSR